ncbi:MAG: pyrB [Candidatus Aminicenantes bacterium]|nr:pyrB [Candidatus Aminicenantes bacterium]
MFELGLDLDLVQDEGGPPAFLPDDQGLLLVADFGLLAIDLGQRGLEGRRVRGLQPGGDRPVLLLDEGLDLVLPVADQPEGDRLDPAGGQAPGDLLPQQGADAVADEPVEDAPGLLGVEQVEIDLAEVLERGPDALLGDLVEGGPEDLLVVVREELAEVPGDGLALAVGIGGQDDTIALAGGLPELGDDLLLVRDDLVGRLEVVIDVDPQLLLGQVADMSHRGLDRVVRAEIVVDGLGLGRRFDDDE